MVKVKIFDMLILSSVCENCMIWEGTIPEYMIPQKGNVYDLNEFDNVKYCWKEHYFVENIKYHKDSIDIYLTPINVQYSNELYFGNQNNICKEPISQRVKTLKSFWGMVKGN